MTATEPAALAPILGFLAASGYAIAIGLGAVAGVTLLGIAFGWNFPVGRELIKIVTGRWFRRTGTSSLLVVSGIAYLLRFGPGLLVSPAEVWQGVLVGAGLVIAGVLYLGVVGRWKLGRLASGFASGAALALVAVSAIGLLPGAAT